MNITVFVETRLGTKDEENTIIFSGGSVENLCNLIIASLPACNYSKVDAWLRQDKGDTLTVEIDPLLDISTEKVKIRLEEMLNEHEFYSTLTVLKVQKIKRE